MPKLQLLKIKFPAYFGFPRAVYQLQEVKDMIHMIETNQLILKDNILTTSFDVSEDLNSQKFLIV